MGDEGLEPGDENATNRRAKPKHPVSVVAMAVAISPIPADLAKKLLADSGTPTDAGNRSGR